MSPVLVRNSYTPLPLSIPVYASSVLNVYETPPASAEKEVPLGSVIVVGLTAADTKRERLRNALEETIERGT